MRKMSGGTCTPVAENTTTTNPARIANHALPMGDRANMAGMAPVMLKNEELPTIRGTSHWKRRITIDETPELLLRKHHLR